MTRIATAGRTAERTLLGSSLAALAALAVGLAMTTPAHAAGESMSGAEKLHRLNIMLMVTGLRCRSTVDNFTADYGRFNASHISELKAANDELKAAMARRYGAVAGQRALEHMSTTMANNYGQGHPWLGCADLKMVARNLVEVRGRATLEEAADQLLSEASPPNFVLAQR
jgi:hypothetical protein